MKTLPSIPEAILLLVFISSISLSAQTADSLRIEDTTRISLKNDIKVQKHSLYAGIGYGSNMVYMGSTISQDKPYGYAALTYGFKNELYLGVSTVHITNLSPFAAFNTFTASYNHTFNSWFDFSAGLSRYQVARSLTDTLFNSFSYGEADLGIDWKILYTKLSAGGIFSNGSKAYYQIKNSRYFQTREFAKKKLYFSIDPYFNFLFGTITKSETITGIKKIVTLPPFLKQRNPGTQTTTNTQYTSAFRLLEISTGLPVSFNTPRLTIEAEPGYIHTLFEDTVYPGTKGFLFLISAYLRIL